MSQFSIGICPLTFWFLRYACNFIFQSATMLKWFLALAASGFFGYGFLQQYPYFNLLSPCRSEVWSVFLSETQSSFHPIFCKHLGGRRDGRQQTTSHRSFADSALAFHPFLLGFLTLVLIINAFTAVLSSLGSSPIKLAFSLQLFRT